MTLACKPVLRRFRPPAPALQRLLEETALSRAAMAICDTPIAIVEVDAKNYAVRYANRAFEQATGRSEEELCGRSIDEVLFADDRRAVDRSITLGMPQEGRLRSRTGELTPVEMRSAPLRAESGVPSHWVITLVDRSEIVRLRSEIAALRSTGCPSDLASVSHR